MTPSRNFEENALKIQKKNKKKFANSQNLTTFAIPKQKGEEPRPGRVFARANTERRKGRHFPHKGGERTNRASSEAATGPGICVSKYGKAKRSPLPPQGGREGGNILRYGVMVALQILALSVRVRVLLSQPRQTKVSDRD